jgi:cold shock CspA family protein
VRTVRGDAGVNVFVHHTAIAAPLADGFKVVAVGARVQFKARAGSRGPVAVRVAAARDGAVRRGTSPGGQIDRW